MKVFGGGDVTRKMEKERRMKQVGEKEREGTFLRNAIETVGGTTLYTVYPITIGPI